MRIVLSGGGTGGHLFPLVAVARALRKRLGPEAELFFIGPKSPWMDALAQEGISVLGVPAGKIPRYATPRLLVELPKIPIGMVLGFLAMFRVMPDVVVGKGGYGMIPAVLAAWVFRIPVVLHESDAVPGLATRIALTFAKAVAFSFPGTETRTGLRRAVVHATIGNPVRETLCQGSLERAQKRFALSGRPVVLVLGGSQGAKELNSIVVQAAPDMVRDADIILQCGANNVQDTFILSEEFRRSDPERARSLHVEGFLSEQDLADAYAAATLVLSRAGAASIFENALAGKPSLLVPLASAAAGHQTVNAGILEEAGAAGVLRPENLSPHLLVKVVREMLADAALLARMHIAALRFARPNAAADFADLVARTVSIPKF